MFNKITGFHCGEPSNTTGIGDYINLYQTIPFIAKAVDGTASLFDAEVAIRNGANGYSIYRVSQGFPNAPNDTGSDVPNYGDDIQTEANRFWSYGKSKFDQSGLDPTITWLELINEPDKAHADWLGELGYAIGQLALQDGYKVMVFGWSSGEPADVDWATTGMQKMINLSVANPDHIAISLHEYSYNINDLFDGYPYKIGRFTELAKYNPTIFITEFGWVYNDAPPLGQMLSEIKAAGEVYNVSAIKGVVIWALDKSPNWGDLNIKMHELMGGSNSPLYDLVSTTPMPDPPPVNPPLNYKSIPVLLPQDATLVEMLTVQNDTYADRRTVTQSHDEAITLVELGLHGSYVIIYNIDRWPPENQAQLLAVPHELKTL